MGQLIVGRPAPKQFVAVSAPLALTSAISLAFRAGYAVDQEESALDPWLIDAWRNLDDDLRHDLDLLLGFSGRLLYYIEELLFAFDPLAPEQLNASFDDYLAFLRALPAARFKEMAADSVVRVYRDRGLSEAPPEDDDPHDWRMFLRPGITRANIDEAVSLVISPGQLKLRTLALLEGFWREVFETEYRATLPDMRKAVRIAQSLMHYSSAQQTFAELTGHRLPEEISLRLADVERVVYSPSTRLGRFIQYVLYPPELILYFDPATVLERRAGATRLPAEGADLSTAEVLEGFRALSDPSRMRIVEMLREGELYAQEIVSRLGISQSAVSRHLSTLESADLVTVRPANGMKYYAIDRGRLNALAAQLAAMADGEPR
ncbi:MAG TPA: metalloregulator ArsR/SmtB family transcription factor [Thermomicrobiales bacterium]|nr:metalloregulator ArsR/SmtB family transcription factor [Thermomicrobiales bacterium]